MHKNKMKKSELIAKLNEIEGDYMVRIFDINKSAHMDGGEGTSEGIHDFSIQVIGENMTEDEREYQQDMFGIEDPQPFIALTFVNDDYPD